MGYFQFVMNEFFNSFGHTWSWTHTRAHRLTNSIQFDFLYVPPNDNSHL